MENTHPDVLIMSINPWAEYLYDDSFVYINIIIMAYNFERCKSLIHKLI